MAANAQIKVEPYSGAENQIFRQFEHLFRGFIGVAAIPANQQSNFLQLHLRDAALRYFQTLLEATRNDLELSLTALRDHYANQDLQEVHVLKLEQLRFDPKTDSPENFLVNLQTKDQRAYPTPNLPAVAALALPGDGGAGDRAEHARFDGETAARAARLQAAEDNKNEQVKRIFIKAMPGWLRSKLMEQPPATLVTDLCTTARQQMTIRDMCRKDDYPEDGFNEINNTASENLINALSKLNQTQDSLDKKLQTIDDRITAAQIETTQRDVTHSPQQSFNRQGQFPAVPYTPRNNYASQLYQNSYRGNNPRGRSFFNRNPRPRFANTNAQVFYPRNFISQSQFRMPTSPYMPVTRSSVTFCYTCGYPNHRSSQCSQRGRTNNRGTSFPFNRQSKN